MRWTLRVLVVLDTNILIGALITKGTPPDRLYQAWLRGEIELVTSTAQIAELADVLAWPRLQRFLDADQARGCHSTMCMTGSAEMSGQHGVASNSEIPGILKWQSDLILKPWKSRHSYSTPTWT